MLQAGLVNGQIDFSHVCFPPEISLLVGVDIRIQCILGNLHRVAQEQAGFCDLEDAFLVKIVECTNLFFLVHQHHRFSDHGCLICAAGTVRAAMSS